MNEKIKADIELFATNYVSAKGWRAFDEFETVAELLTEIETNFEFLDFPFSFYSHLGEDCYILAVAPFSELNGKSIIIESDFFNNPHDIKEFMRDIEGLFTEYNKVKALLATIKQ